MYLLPLLELKNGESVHILEGHGQGESRPLMDPIEVANRLIGLGAQGFHIVDVDRAQDPSRDNDAALFNLLQHTVYPVQAGGGVRSLKRIQELLDTGCRRVLVGTMGVQHPDWLKEASLIFRERLIACVDVGPDGILIKGRTEKAETTTDAFLERVDGIGLEALHVAYVGPNGQGIPFVESLAKKLRTPVTYQGPISSNADLARLEKAGIKGVIVGQEIYDGRLSFHELAKTYRVR